ncbi:HTTM domain-containing protein [Seonamhaeicola sp.]|uniref:HTTM domain-containing protein n=1 Tax=Seonamhaeicola sp. TaxID=1912245 RepID=UPI00261C73EF|nr:HTTM domain-containing protein [Seonamhaeicola sp.]
MKWFNKLYEKKISATGLSVFRITFFLNLFFEVLHLFKYRHLYFDSIPYIELSSANESLFILIWLVVLVCIVLGLFTRVLTIINYIFCVTILSSFTDFEYHMHYVYVGISFIAILLPLSRSFTIQNIFFKEGQREQKVSVLYYYLPVVVGIAFVYFDSVFHKITSQIWINGLGVWFPASLPQITIINDQWLLNQKGFMLFLGYLTFVFEALFLFVFWMKKMRIPMFIIGMGLHVGILLEFPIPNFAFGMMTLYTLMLPVSFWDRLKSKISIFKPREHLYSIKQIFNLDKKSVLMTVFIILTFFQINVTLQSPFIRPQLYKLIGKIGIEDYFDPVSYPLMNFSTKAFGITKHPVFMDNHFKGYNHILSISYVDNSNGETLLPIINEKGMVGTYLRGSVWVNWSYRVNSPEVDQTQLKNGLFAYSAYWAHKNNIDLTDAVFKVKVKKIELPNWKWEEDYLTKQLHKPWQNAGSVLWKDKKPELTLIKPIEEF